MIFKLYFLIAFVTVAKSFSYYNRKHIENSDDNTNELLQNINGFIVLSRSAENYDEPDNGDKNEIINRNNVIASISDRSIENDILPFYKRRRVFSAPLNDSEIPKVPRSKDFFSSEEKNFGSLEGFMNSASEEKEKIHDKPKKYRDSDESNDADVKVKKPFKKDSSTEYESGSVEKRKPPTRLQKIPEENLEEQYYLQGGNVVQGKMVGGRGNNDVKDDWRRRLSYFLPKRYHWDSRDIDYLGYFWFNENKGRFPSPVGLKY